MQAEGELFSSTKHLSMYSTLLTPGTNALGNKVEACYRKACFSVNFFCNLLGIWQGDIKHLATLVASGVIVGRQIVVKSVAPFGHTDFFYAAKLCQGI